MSVDAKVMARAHARYLDRQKRSREDISARAAALSEKIPRIGDISQELSLTGLSITRTMLDLRDDQAQRQIEALRRRNLALQEERAALLQENGYPPDYLNAGIFCPLCDDTGYRSGVLCACLEELYRDELLRELEQSAGRDAASFERFNQRLFELRGRDLGEESKRERREMFKICREYASRLKYGPEDLIIFGNSGRGKTFLAVSMVRDAIEHGHTALYAGSGEFFGHYENDRFRRDELSREALLRLRSCDVLTLDDLGMEPSAPFNSAALFDLLNARLVARRSTILCASLPQSDLAARYSHTVASRIADGYTVVDLSGADLRRLSKNV